MVERESSEEPETAKGRRDAGMTRKGDRYLPVTVLVICLLAYTLLCLYNLHGRLIEVNSSGDEPHYLLLAESILEDGDISLENNYASGSYREKGYYQSGTLQTHWTKGRGGRLVPWHPVFLSLLILPGFALGGFRGAGMTMVLFTGFSAMLTFLIMRRFTGRYLALALTLFFFLTYPLITYSRMVYPEVVVMFLLTLGTWALLRLGEGGGPLYAVVGGLSAGILPLMHAKFVVFSLTLLLLFYLTKRRNRDWAFFLVPFGAFIVVLLAWTAYLFGPDIIHGLTVTSGSRGLIQKFSAWRISGLYLDRTWGLMPYAPLYLAMFAGLPLPEKRGLTRSRWVFIPVTFAAYTLVVGSFWEWHGGTAPAPRYLVPLLPLMALCCGLAAAGARRAVVRALLAALALFQLVLTVFALVYPLGTYAIPAHENNLLYHRFLGDNPISATLERLFPLLHPVRTWSIGVLALWIVFICAMVYARRWYLEKTPGEVLGSGSAPPVT